MYTKILQIIRSIRNKASLPWQVTQPARLSHRSQSPSADQTPNSTSTTTATTSTAPSASGSVSHRLTT